MQQHTQEQIEEIKKNHPEAWQAKRAAGLDEQLVASVILAQVEHDQKHPPEAEARARLDRANAIITAHLQRACEAAKGAEAIAAEIRVLFPDMEIQIVEVGASDEAEHTANVNMVETLHRLEVLQRDNAVLVAARNEAAQELTTSMQAGEELLAENDKLKKRVTALDAELKAAQEALKGIAAATKLKDAKDAAEAALKPAPTPAGDDAPKADAAA